MVKTLRGIPTWFVLPALLALLALVLPLLGMTARVPWSDLGTILTSESSLDALWLSLKTCLVSTVICLALGTPLALVFARASELPRRPRWLTPARTAVLVPLVMPPVVSGLALLTTFGRRGTLGPALEAFGIQIPFTTLAVVLAQIFVSLPYLVITVETAAKAAGSDLEHAARGLGASRWIQFSRITLPVLGPSIASGGALAFARSLGEFGATITFAGSMQGTTRTLPLEVYLQREQDTDTAIALSLVLIAIAIVLTGATAILEARNMRRFDSNPGAEYDAAPAGTEEDRPENGRAEHDVNAGSPASGPSSTAMPFALTANVPARDVSYELDGRPGETLAIIGPNGSGKSTGIRLLAGDITDPKSSVTVPDTVGFLDQSPALFPHMSVLDNVAFGPRCHGVPKVQARERARAELRGVGLEAHEHKAPWQLSGGQAQRVALARVLAVDPQLLLLDEPFAALDTASSAALRSVISGRIRGLTAVLVTHDLIDVLTLADRVAVLDNGCLVGVDSMEKVLSEPPTEFVANFAGLNMQFGQVRDGGLELEGTELRLQGEIGDLNEGDRAAAIFDPRAVSLRTAPSNSSIRNVIPGTVVAIEASRSGVETRIDIGSTSPIRATITSAASAELEIRVGSPIFAEVKAMQVRMMPVAPRT
ncbi:molybdate transport system permease protein [Trueperella bonasi]|uniref:Molybdate transport system permease protein n=1 Tax=Trueperella bonasi TaxID=312286 RepID=A0ABT9NFU2_9ACTO|nr:ABC transporter permease [Trueperella bonasi]MDP9806251.1 molybdate transport system permease protein [Trueperella bonasi]